MTLSGADDQTLWFTDRPYCLAFTQPTTEFVSGFGMEFSSGTGGNPNAVLNWDDATTGDDKSIVVELHAPQLQCQRPDADLQSLWPAPQRPGHPCAAAGQPASEAGGCNGHVGAMPTLHRQAGSVSQPLWPPYQRRPSSSEQNSPPRDRTPHSHLLNRRTKQIIIAISSLGWSDPTPFLHDDGLPKRPKDKRWRDWVVGTRDKGPKFGNYSGWRVGNELKVIDEVIRRDQPEVAIVMLGTNDIAGGKVPQGYETGLEQIVDKCLAVGCVPIINTIPPRRDREEAVLAANAIIRKLAARKQIPLADFHAAIVKCRPSNSWDGTLISKDGVHPSGGKSQDYSADNLKTCGYALRTCVNFLALRELYFRVLHPEEAR